MRGVRMTMIAGGLAAGLCLVPLSVSGQVVTTGTGATGSWVDGGWQGWWWRSFVVPPNARTLQSFQVWVQGALGDVTTSRYPSEAFLDGVEGSIEFPFYGDGILHLSGFTVAPGQTWNFGFNYMDCLDHGSCWEPGDPGCLYPARCNQTREAVWDARPMILVADDGGLAYTATFTTTPEPASLLLFGPAALLLGAIRRRRARPR